jgi:hypothetical protein
MLGYIDRTGQDAGFPIRRRRPKASSLCRLSAFWDRTFSSVTAVHCRRTSATLSSAPFIPSQAPAISFTTALGPPDRVKAFDVFVLDYCTQAGLQFLHRYYEVTLLEETDALAVQPF